MRIISGKFKSRRFTPPADKWPTRPTTDFAKEGLFNVLNNRIDFEETRVLDLFGGTGSHGYEFISRGCPHVTYVEQHGPAIAFVRKTTKELDIEAQMNIIRSDVFRYIPMAGTQFDYIFAGPPYGLSNLNDIPDLIFQHNLLKKDGLFVLEHNPSHDFTNHTYFELVRSYGTTLFSFFSYPSDEEE